MKVSIAMITYNHQKFIAQSVESVLMQQVNFDYEIVIGEDCSTDNTRQIVLKLKKKHPDKIRLLLPEKNLGRPYNFIQTLQSCQGEYIATLEGDDYWTFPYKLQMLSDYLDDQPNCAICFHSVRFVFENSNRNPRVMFPPGQKKHYCLKDLLKGNLSTTGSMMFRNGLFGPFPDWYYDMPMGDWPLNILNAQHGDIGYIDQVMGVHRLHGEGVWSREGQIQRSKWVIQVYQAINKHLDYKYDSLIKSGIHFQRCKIALEKKDRLEALKNLLKCIAASPLEPVITPKRFLLTVAKLLSPERYKLVKSWKHRATNDVELEES